MTCEVCGGSGFVEHRRADGTSYSTRCECYTKKRLAALIERSGVSKAYRDKTVNGYIAKSADGKKLKTEIITYAKSFDDMVDKGVGIYIYSKMKGSGKTHLASALCIAAINMYQTQAKIITLIDLFAEVKASYDDRELRSDLIMNKYKTCKFLVLDDIGTENVTAWADETLYDIVDYREKAQLPTVYTSNCPISALKYDERIKSRIRGHSIECHADEIDNRKLVLSEAQ